MSTADIFGLADLCIEAGFFPRLVGQKYVLALEAESTERVKIHRAAACSRFVIPCRVWLMSGKTTVLLGDSHALPGDLCSGVRPPWTG